MVGRHDGRGRSLLQGEGRASVLIAHGRLVRRVRRVQHPDHQEVGFPDVRTACETYTDFVTHI
jgi:hypothetical protein